MPRRTVVSGHLQSAKDTASRAVPDPSTLYLDAHAWCLTPSTFELPILEIGALDLVPLLGRAGARRPEPH